ncbi:MAG: hypothetical protein ACTHU0_36520 [Kofleriaceae bacterium]
MITPGLAYSISYEPHRLALLQANEELLARLAANPRVMADPKRKHAVEFATQAAKIEQKIAAEKIGDMIAQARSSGVEIPQLPASYTEWEPWREALAAQAKSRYSNAQLAGAFEAGAAAAALRVGWGRAAQVAYLRASSPDQPDLAAEAESIANELSAPAKRLEAILSRFRRPIVDEVVAGLRRVLSRAPQPDATSTLGYPSTFAAIVDWTKGLDSKLGTVPRALDAPVDPIPTADPTPEEQQLFSQILAEPGAIEPRRRYAELAAKRSDPRAELLQEQLALSELQSRNASEGQHPARIRQLVLSHPEWAAPLTELGARDVKFHLGFPWQITIDISSLLGHASELFVRAPITSVAVRGGLGTRGPALARLPELAKLTALDLYDQGMTDDDLIALASSPSARNLVFLQLGKNKLTDRGIEALAAASKNLPALATVVLDLNPGTDPIDERKYHGETHHHRVPTEAGRALEQKYGPIRWLHPRDDQ